MPERIRPNIVVFLADDLAYGDLGCHGNDAVQTPHIDRFAAESVEMDRFYVSPVCAPTRASLMTGRWNFRTGVSDVFGTGCEMTPSESTVAEDLKAAGYVTGLFGKWHLGDKGPQRPTQRGFDETLTFEGAAMFADQYFDPVLLHNDRPEKWPGYCMDVFTDGAIDFVRRHRREPFFVYLPANLIHTPMVAPDSLIAQFDNLGLLDSTQTIYGMIASLDRNFGRLRAALAQLGLEENTLLMVLSDNGPCSGSQPVERHMAGLHGLKGTPYENGIRVPSFIRWPAELTGGSKVDSPVAHVDIRPTILEAAGVAQSDNKEVDGMSLLPVLRSASGKPGVIEPPSTEDTPSRVATDPSNGVAHSAAGGGVAAVPPGIAGTAGGDALDAVGRARATELANRPIVLQWDSGMEPRHGRAYCVIEDRWKLVQPCGMDAAGQQHIRDRYTELCLLQGRGERSIEGEPRFELYDLAADPGEWNDLAGEHPERVAALRETYDRWFEDVTSGG